MIKKIIFLAGFTMATTLALAEPQPIVTDSTTRNTSTSTNTSNTTSESTVRSTPPTAVAPAVTSINNDVCAIVASGAVQTQIFGISMGGTMRDMNCERIKLAKNLFDMGMKVAAVATLCQDERVFAAMTAAGTPCPVDGMIGAQARQEWERRGVTATTDLIGFYAVQPPRTPEPVQRREQSSDCTYQGDDPVVMARVCGK